MEPVHNFHRHMLESEQKKILSAAADFLWSTRFQQHSDDFVATNAPLFIGAVCRNPVFFSEAYLVDSNIPLSVRMCLFSSLGFTASNAWSTNNCTCSTARYMSARLSNFVSGKTLHSELLWTHAKLPSFIPNGQSMLASPSACWP